MELETFTTTGLGDNSYLLASEGEAVLVDPQRDAWRFLRVAEERGLRVRYVLETHVHNDYLTGALEVRKATGAEVVVSARGGYAFPHHPVAEGDEIWVGALRLVVAETPGHTPEHLAYLVFGDAEGPEAAFTGGSIIVGGVARMDLLGPEYTEGLAREQFRSVQRLAQLPDRAAVLPTHGPGSFCISNVKTGEKTSTIGNERHRNPALLAPDEATFMKEQLFGLPAYPAYYRHIAPINRAGPRLLGGVSTPPALSPEETAQRMDAGAWLVDARDRLDFAEAHMPGSVNIALSSVFGTYVGWVIPFNAPVVLVTSDWSALEDAVIQMLRIGYERVEGYLAGGVEAWRDSGRPVRSYGTMDIDDLCRLYQEGQMPRVLDVRQQTEWEQGHIPDSMHIFLGDVPKRLDDVPKDREMWVTCSSGYRSSIAASLLDRADVPVVLVARDGVPEWLARCYPG